MANNRTILTNITTSFTRLTVKSQSYRATFPHQKTNVIHSCHSVCFLSKLTLYTDLQNISLKLTVL